MKTATASARLTNRQQQVVDIINRENKRHRRGPTVRQICKEMGIRSPNGVVCHLKALERKGVIIHWPNEVGGVRVAPRQ